MKVIEQRARKVCKDLQIRGVFRKIRHPDQKLRLNLASNDYLGVVRRGLLQSSLAKHANITATGGAASRLVFGTTKSHRLFEEKIAEHFGYEAALVFTSGFMANYGLCTAIKELADAIIIDKRVHASIVDGLMQSMGSKAEIRSYKHNELNHYRQIADSYAGNGLITITESLFSMTGRLCDPRVIKEASERSYLIVDEAHSVGVCAPKGGAVYGNVCGADVTVGTFGKAFGSLGGFILCSADMQTYLINRCRSFIFTTALPEVYAAVGIDAIDLVARMDEEREKLRDLSKYLAQGLVSAGFRISGDAHIIALYCIGAEEAVELSRQLYERGIALYAVRPPTVPPREILLRISLNATLEKSDLDFFMEQLGRIRADSPQMFERI